MNILDRAALLRLYTTMVRIRLTEDRLADLVEAGEIGCPCHLCIGQEAVATGACAALDADDYVWGGHRSHGHYLAKGGALDPMIAEIYGRANGCSGGRGGSMHLLATDVSILGTVPLVAATIPLAVGTALASKLRGDGRTSVSFFGDGATEEGHFHESLNMAALYSLPVIFVCENNLYASHMALHERRAADNIVKSAEAHGLRGEIVDGNNVVAVYEAARTAVECARAGKGPTLLECRTFRWRGHVGASWDMDVGVKRRDELKEWLSRDPIARLRDAIAADNTADHVIFERIEADVRLEIDRAVERARAAPYPRAADLYEHVYSAQTVNW